MTLNCLGGRNLSGQVCTLLQRRNRIEHKADQQGRFKKYQHNIKFYIYPNDFVKIRNGSTKLNLKFHGETIKRCK